MTSMSNLPADDSSSSPSADPIELAGRAFVLGLSSGDFAALVSKFDATMTAALPEPKLRETWAGLGAGVGSFQGIESARVETVGAYRTAIVTCTFARARLDAKIAFDKEGKVAGLFFSPAAEPYQDPPYVDRSRFTESELSFGAAGFELPGTLSLPTGKGPFRAVVLVHGSGPNDRDESVGANKPFKDLAGGLASRGIAVLRYEKRTKQHPTKLAGLELTVREETIDDAKLAVKWLGAHSAIDKTKIALVGHSLGGFLAPRIGAETAELAGIALLAGSTRPIADMMIEQMEYIAALDGRAAPEESEQIAAVKRARTRIAEIIASGAGRPGELVLGAPAAYWLDLAKYDALAAARDYKRPIFVAQGGRDYQVTDTDFGAWQRVLAGRKNVTNKRYSELNHLFGAGEGKSSPAEYQQRAPVDARLIEDLSAWVHALP